MATVKIMQGDSYSVFVSLKMKNTGDPVTPDMVDDVEICVGEDLRKTYAAGQVFYDETMLQWYFIPSQEETFALEPDAYEVQARIRFKNGQYSPTKGIDVGRILILDAHSSEVI